MTYPPTSGQPDPNQQPQYGQPSDPNAQPNYPYSDPYAQQPGSPAAPYGGQQYGQPQYGQPQYGAPQYPAGGYAQAPGTNILAILSLVFAFVFSPAGIVLGHIAKKQIKERGEQGAGLANWGLILSYVFTGLAVLFCCGGIILGIMAENSGSTSSGY
jgi:hypothetical protein